MIEITQDGTTTLYSEKFKQFYHSIFGAKAESNRVFIELGLKYAFKNFEDIRILEIGLGTGFNAMLSSTRCQEEKRKVDYSALEPFPISLEIAQTLNFDASIFHTVPWEVENQINPHFSFTKYQSFLEEFETELPFNLVYYDAFPPSSQPELWTQDVFEKVASLMVKDGILVTYCSKGYVQRNLKAAGFKVEKHSGPPRKREVLRAILK